MSAPLTLEGVTHSYRTGGVDLEVLHGIDLEVEGGTVVALRGPSGSGKTTLCHLAAGLLEPQRGRVLVAGSDPRSAADWSRVALAPQGGGLLHGLSVLDNLALPAHRRGLTAELADRAEDLLLRLDLQRVAERAVESTSLGEQQRVGIARALLLRPTLAVLDEPTAHQDHAHAVEVVAAVRADLSPERSALIATHDPLVLEQVDVVVDLAPAR